jgi:tetratricopeptide (TPR) repeat protein
MANSQGSGRKSPPAPVKIHHFEKRSARGMSPGRRQGDGSMAEHPTVPEIPLEPRLGGAAAEASPLAPRPKSRAAVSSKAESAVSGRGSPARPSQKSSGHREKTPAGGQSAFGSVAERLATARRLITEDQLEEAQLILERLVTMGVATGPVFTQLGALYMAQGSTEKALAFFEEALSLDPMDLMARVCRGEARLWRGDLRLALEDLHTVLDAGTAGSPLVQRAQYLMEQLEEQQDRKRR